MHDPKLLNVLVETVRTGSFTGAADVLHCSPGAVSKSIGRLERDLGVRLFHRTTRQICLTDEGRQIHEAAAAGFASLERIDDIAAVARGEVSGTIRAVMGVAVGRFDVIPALGKFLECHPRLNVEVALTDQTPDIIAKGYDVALRYGEPEDSRYISRRLCSISLALVASPAYLRTHGKPERPEDIPFHQCIGVQFAGETFGWRFARNDMRGRASFSHMPSGRLRISNQPEAVLEAVLDGLGIAVVHEMAARQHIASGDLQTLLPSWTVDADVPGGTDVYLTYPHRDHMPLRLRTFIDFLVETVGRHEPARALATSRFQAPVRTLVA
jgi:DNA-binding transcriptional LysR family regulator